MSGMDTGLVVYWCKNQEKIVSWECPICKHKNPTRKWICEECKCVKRPKLSNKFKKKQTEVTKK